MFSSPSLNFRRPKARLHGIAWRGLRHLDILALDTSASTVERQLEVRNAFILMNASPQVYLFSVVDRRMAFHAG